MNVEHIVRDVPAGATMLIADGEMELHVEQKSAEELVCRVMRDCTLRSRKSVNVPNVSIDLPSVTEKDRMYIEWATENGVDFIAHSFVRSARDVEAVQAILDSRNSGIKIISKVCEKLVPFMAIAYAWGCIVIIGMNWEFVWPAICLIFECAFTPKAAFGGAVGSGLMMALQFGCARGLFSNESGRGSAPIGASAASTRNPAQQALVAMTGTFWSTVVICALTGIVLVSTMLANPDIASSIMANPTVYSGAMLASEAFAKIPYIGTPILVLGMVAFSYTTILGWSYYGNRCITYLFGRYAIRPYQVIYVAVAFLGAIGVGDIVWTISDIGNALMAIPNIIVVLLLSGMIARETRHYVYDGNLDEADDTPILQLEGK